MFKLFSHTLDITPYLKELRHPSSGAFVSFEGWVRDNHNGQAVCALEYEALTALSESEAKKIIAEATLKFGMTRAICLHRTGRLAIGEMSVWVGVTASHRDAAFKACRYIIDELKQRLPIWKKEYFADGSHRWVNCQNENSRRSDESEYYSRQTILPEIGLSGQEKLKASRILVVGAGGLGCAALTSLTQVGVGTIGIVEFDQVHISNLHRQSLYSADDIGGNKIDLAAKRLLSLNPYLRIIRFPSRIKANNFKDIIKDFDIILDCTDNFTAKFLLNDIAVLHKKELVQAGIYQFEGQLCTYLPDEKTSCLRCLWPKMPDPGCLGDCAQAGVFGAVANVMGHLQAWEAVKSVLKMPGRLINEVLIFDFKRGEISKIKLFPDSSCPVCGEKSGLLTIQEEIDMNTSDENAKSIDINTIPADKINEYVFVDVREEMELMLSPVSAIKSVHLPFSRFREWDFEFQDNKKYLIYCAHGMRSMACVEGLSAQGVNNVQSVKHGAHAVQQYFAAHPGAAS